MAENGIHLDEIEKTIADHGFDMHKVGLQLSENELKNAAGGFHDSDYAADLECPWCKNNSRIIFFRQAWRSMFFKMKSC